MEPNIFEKPKTQKLLLVDDEPANIQVLHNVLADDGYDFIFATDGDTALTLATAQAPDVILLDVMMPDMDGYEVCRRLKNDPTTSNIPVIFITALDQMEDEEKGLNLGAIDYLKKPLGPSIARARVRNHLQLKSYRDRLEKMAMYDGLTGIANRQYFDHYFDAELKRASRSNSFISLILMDIDHFKQFNDNCGHAAGDECLKKVAKALAETLERPSDLAARYGGEEFVCVLPNTQPDGAQKVSGQLLDAVRSLNITHEHSSAASVVTVSLGCVTVNGETALDAQRIIQATDQRLYKAKHDGRNRAVIDIV